MDVSLFIGSLNLRIFAQLVVDTFVSETFITLLTVIKNLSKKILRNDSSLLSTNIFSKKNIHDALVPSATLFS
ncbi:Uncharacterised protein [Yersinia similis]|nr:Uncharacterised protein [Yersinia similis]